VISVHDQKPFASEWKFVEYVLDLARMVDVSMVVHVVRQQMRYFERVVGAAAIYDMYVV
jgi:hypothetical protein